MPASSRVTSSQRIVRLTVICTALTLAACAATPKPKPKPQPEKETTVTAPVSDVEIADISHIPQDLANLVDAAGDRIAIGETCRDQLLDDFRKRYFSRWNSSPPLYQHEESREFMKKETRGAWFGVNKRKVSRKQMRELLDNCALDSFPSRNETAIAVAPGHLRGLPTELPFYERSDGAPFDMLSYPQVKLNEPLRVLHTSRDGIWLFVESGSSNGWLEKRDVALVDAELIESWMKGPLLVIIRDYQPIDDGRGVGAYPAKIGTLLPLVQEGEGWWEVTVASAGEGGKAELHRSRIPKGAAAPFPLSFAKENLALLGNQLLGQPYGWGEVYGLRDCSALLRDFFLPFGIWLPRTSADQLASLPRRLELASLTPAQKEETLRAKAVPFLTLLYKPGHVMLYVGENEEGRPLVFHGAWSLPVQEGEGQEPKVIGTTAITTMEPGKELGLVPGRSLIERITELGTITNRCR